MKKLGIFFFLFVFAYWGPAATAAVPDDFAVVDIVQGGDGFIHVKLRNLSAKPFQVTPALKEEIFLSLYINNIKRSEYKLKYIDAALFRPGGTSVFRTNFRVSPGTPLNVKVRLNEKKIFPEADYNNNTLEKRLSS